VGDSVIIDQQKFLFKELQQVPHSNYMSFVATVVVDNQKILQPEKRFYSIRSMSMTEAAIDGSLFLTLGEKITNESWAFRIQNKPLVHWIWFGGFLMAFGALISIFDKRYRSLK
jgi:cytochrome c-type biogenesis protein CcmF